MARAAAVVAGWLGAGRGEGLPLEAGVAGGG